MCNWSHPIQSNPCMDRIHVRVCVDPKFTRRCGRCNCGSPARTSSFDIIPAVPDIIYGPRRIYGRRTWLCYCNSQWTENCKGYVQRACRLGRWPGGDWRVYRTSVQLAHLSPSHKLQQRAIINRASSLAKHIIYAHSAYIGRQNESFRCISIRFVRRTISLITVLPVCDACRLLVGQIP